MAPPPVRRVRFLGKTAEDVEDVARERAVPPPAAGTPPQSLKTSLAVALDPRVGSGVMDRWTPLVVTIATVALALGCAFGLVPGADFQDAVLLLGGVGAGGLVVHAGSR